MSGPEKVTVIPENTFKSRNKMKRIEDEVAAPDMPGAPSQSTLGTREELIRTVYKQSPDNRVLNL